MLKTANIRMHYIWALTASLWILFYFIRLGCFGA